MPGYWKRVRGTRTQCFFLLNFFLSNRSYMVFLVKWLDVRPRLSYVLHGIGGFLQLLELSQVGLFSRQLRDATKKHNWAGFLNQKKPMKLHRQATPNSVRGEVQEVIAATATKRTSTLHENQCLWFLYTGLSFSQKHRCLGSAAACACKIHVSTCSTRSVLQDLCKVHLSGSFTELLRKIHVSGFSPRSMSQDPSQDQNFRTSMQEPCVWILCRVLVQDPCFRICTGSMSARSMAPDPLEDPCLRIHVSVSICANPLQDAYLRTYVSASLSVGPLQDPCLRIHYRVHGSG